MTLRDVDVMLTDVQVEPKASTLSVEVPHAITQVVRTHCRQLVTSSLTTMNSCYGNCGAGAIDVVSRVRVHRLPSDEIIARPTIGERLNFRGAWVSIEHISKQISLLFNIWTRTAISFWMTDVDWLMAALETRGVVYIVCRVIHVITLSCANV